MTGPIFAGSGLTGWTYLKRTAAQQTDRLATRPDMAREAAWFRDRIGQVDTAEELVADRRLLKVTLEAFGLEADLPNRFFIRKVLEGGTLKTDSLANRLSDPAYRKLAAAFGFGDFSVPSTKISDFPDRILSQWKIRRFEAEVGQRDNDLRLALNARRELAELAGRTGSDATMWFGIMASPPLRRVVEGALGLPQATGRLDIDRQLSLFRDKAQAVLGDPRVAQFREPEKVEALVRLFLLRSDPTLAPLPSQSALSLITAGQSMFRRL